MRRIDGARQTVLGHLRQLGGLGLGQGKVGRHHGDGGVADGGRGGRGGSGWVGEAGQGAEFRPDPQAGAQEFPGDGVDHAAKGVDRHQSPNPDALAQIKAGGPQSPLEIASQGDGPGPGANIAEGEGAGGQIGARPAAELSRGAVAKVAAEAFQIEEHRTGDDGHHPALTQGPAQALVFQPAHDPVRRCQAEGAAAGEDDGVDPVDQVHRVQEVGLASPRG